MMRREQNLIFETVRRNGVKDKAVIKAVTDYQLL